MSDFKRFKSYGGSTYGYRSYCEISRMLNSIWNQNEQIIVKLKDIEEFLFKKFADTVAKQVLKEDGKSS
ncbi:MAG: hypothetical protein QXR17_08680 [Candidatus Bathyarchaeia archaeon]